MLTVHITAQGDEEPLARGGHSRGRGPRQDQGDDLRPVQRVYALHHHLRGVPAATLRGGLHPLRTTHPIGTYAAVQIFA